MSVEYARSRRYIATPMRPEHVEAFDQIALERGCSRAQVVREVLITYLRQQQQEADLEQWIKTRIRAPQAGGR